MSQSESGRYSREFMLKAVERLEAGERASALASELKLNRTIVYHWRDRVRAKGPQALTSKRGRRRRLDAVAAQNVRAPRPTVSDLAQARAQIAQLERLVGQQQLDLDFFKDALQHIEDSRRPSDALGVTASSPTSRR
jgi:transposase